MEKEEPVVDLIKGGVSMILERLTSIVYNTVVYGELFTQGLFYFGCVAVALAVLYYIWRYMRPRLFSPCHTEKDFPKKAGEIYDRAFELMARISMAAKEDGRLSDLSSQIDRLNAMGVTADDFAFTYQFADYLLGHGTPGIFWFFAQFDKNVIHLMAPPKVREFLCPNGTLDEGRLSDYRAREYSAIMDFRKSVANASAAMGPLDRLSTETPRSLLSAWLAVHELDVSLNSYADALVRANDLRRTHGIAFQLTILKIYLSEFSHYVFVTEIKETIWGGMSAWSTMFQDRIRSLYDTLVTDLNDLLDAKINERQENFGVLFGALSAIFNLIPKVIKLVFKMFEKVADFFDDPLAFFEWIIACMILFVLLLCVNILGGMFVAIWLVPVAIASAFIVCVVLTAFWLAAYYFMFIALVVLTAIDLLTGGHVLMLFRCENLPDAWSNAPGFQKDNLYERQLVCMRPCSEGFEPKGMFCTALSSAEPPFCPHQYIYSALSRSPLVATAILTATVKKPLSTRTYVFHPGVEYWAATEEGKSKIIREFYATLWGYVGSCIKAFAPFDKLTKSMCANIDALSPEAKGDIRQLCTQIYCEMTDAPASWCDVSDKKPPPPTNDKIDDDATIMTKILVTAATVSVACVLLYSLHGRLTIFSS